MSAIKRLAKCPFLPARLMAEPAAWFMGMSVGSFRTRYGHLGVREGGNVYWATRQLQELIDAQFNLPPSLPGIAPEPRDDTWDDFVSP